MAAVSYTHLDVYKRQARKYTKYISWDILITIACAFAISKAMVNSGVADAVARFIIGMSPVSYTHLA